MHASNLLTFVDYNTLAGTQMDQGTYWKHQFRPFACHKQLVEFEILNVELLG